MYNATVRAKPMAALTAVRVNKETGERTEEPPQTLMGRRIPRDQF
jgi:hypothetical protein